MLYLSRYCYSNLYRVNKKGLFNVSYSGRRGHAVDEENLKAVSLYLRDAQVDISRKDFAAAVSDAREGDFVYFDSPYLPASGTAGFTAYTSKGFDADEHLRLAELFRDLDARGVKLMLSNSAAPLALELYKGYKVRRVATRQTISAKSDER